MLGALPLRTPQELAVMREAGRIVAQVLARLSKLAAPGVTTGELDAAAEELIRRSGGTPAFKGYSPGGRSPFPATICASVNDEVIHGIPGRRVLREGDIVGLDVGVECQGFFADAAVTVPIGRVNDEAERLLRVCAEALRLAIALVKPGIALSQISGAIGRHAEKNGFSVVRDFVGHGIGTTMHQPPEVPNYVTRRHADVMLEPGLVIAIEPMINAGHHRVRIDEKNGWTARTADGRLSAHFEHTVAVTPGGHEVLTLP